MISAGKMMSKLVKIFFLFAIAVPALFCRAQSSLKTQYDYAVNLYNKGKYFDAVTEFKRLIFFDTKKIYTYAAYEIMGNAYKEGAKFSDAVLCYTYAELNAKTESELLNAKLDVIRANILRRTTGHALALLDTLGQDRRFTLEQKTILYWKGWANIFSDDWGKAAECFAATDSNKVLEKFCRKVEKDKYSVTAAKLLSKFIPGAGQFYSGEYLSGLLSLGWNVLWGYLTVEAFTANRVWDGLAVGNFLLLRFYNGNLQNAVKFAEEKNLKITNQALNYLQYEYEGTKP